VYFSPGSIGETTLPKTDRRPEGKHQDVALRRLHEKKEETMVADPDFCFYGTTADRPVQYSNQTRPAAARPTTFEQEAKRRLRDYSVLTLDCYGTLVDRDTGIINALMPSLNDAGVTAGRGEILRAFSQAERARLVTAPGICYRDLLIDIHDSLARFFEIESDAKAAEAFARSIKDWPVHPDVPAALAYLKQHYRLVVLTNVDHQSFKMTNKVLGGEFDAVYTAEDIGTYKPSMRSFDYLLSRLAKHRSPVTKRSGNACDAAAQTTEMR
jgi:2-haloalkanoic acid dehalogenase type II